MKDACSTVQAMIKVLIHFKSQIKRGLNCLSDECLESIMGKGENSDF